MPTFVWLPFDATHFSPGVQLITVGYEAFKDRKSSSSSPPATSSEEQVDVWTPVVRPNCMDVDMGTEKRDDLYKNLAGWKTSVVRKSVNADIVFRLFKRRRRRSRLCNVNFSRGTGKNVEKMDGD